MSTKYGMLDFTWLYITYSEKCQDTKVRKILKLFKVGGKPPDESLCLNTRVCSGMKDSHFI